MNKPQECLGCPMYQDGTGFVPDEVIEGAPVFVLGQNPGEDEEREARPFVGKTGQVMMTTYFPAAGLIRGENVSIGNAIRCRWQGSNNLPSGRTLAVSIAHCNKAYLRVPESTKLVVAQGAVALRAISPTQTLSVTDWRGFLIPGGYNECKSGDPTESKESESQSIRKVDTHSKSTSKKTRLDSGPD